MQVEVPASWANAVDENEAPTLEGRAEVVKMVREIMEPVGRMDGDRLPVSAFVDHADGQFEQGAAAYEKRGVAVSVPAWDAATCIQCNQCAFACPHATIRPFALTEEEAAAAPAATVMVPAKGKAAAGLQYTLAISPLDCMGCGVCVNVCPSDSLAMVSTESQLAQQDVFDYCVDNVSDKPALEDATVKGSQFKQPLLEFSGACAGCAETAYAKLVTQLFGDRMYVANATGCSSIWGGPAATSPYTVNAEGRGPAWSNSLFEDNAEHGLGMLLGHEAVRDRLVGKLEAMAANDKTPAETRILSRRTSTPWPMARRTPRPSRRSFPRSRLLRERLPGAPEILQNKEYLNKKSVWIFGGDGWAYDIGYGGLDHVLASGEDVNVFVFDTEVYSNTGRSGFEGNQHRPGRPVRGRGQGRKKKSLTEIAMAYGYVYVAQWLPSGAKRPRPSRPSPRPRPIPDRR